MQSLLRACIFSVLLISAFAARSQPWTRIAGLPIKNYFAMEVLGTTMYAGATDTIFYSKDRGATWTMRKLPTSGFRVQAFTSFNGRLFVGTGDGAFMSGDNGVSWVPSNVHVPINDFEQWNGDLYAATHGGGVFKCSQVSNTWSPFNTNLSVSSDGFIARVIQAGASIIAFSTNGSVYNYDDSLQKWMYSKLNVGSASGTQVTDAAKDGSTIYVQIVDDKTPLLARSEDTAGSWTADAADLQTAAVGGVMLRGYNDTYLFWNNSSATWKQERKNGLANSSWGSNDESLSFGDVSAAREYDRKLFVATATGVWSKPNGSPSVSVAGSQKEPELHLYPNPAVNGQALIRALGLTSVRIYDITGRVVFEQPSVKNNELKIQISQPGVYTLSMIVNGQKVSRLLQVL